MSDVTGDLSNTGSRISKELLFGFTFTFLGLSFAFVVFRLSVRWKVFGKLFWDDALVLLAWLAFLAISIAWWIEREGIYIIWYLNFGIKPVTQHNLDLVFSQFRLALVAQLVFTFGLWLIKLSFLIFFRRLGAPQLSLRIWWWIVTVFTVITFFGLIGAIPWQCTTTDLSLLIERCGNKRYDYHRLVLFYTHLAADITSDLLIISIPVFMLWNVRIPLKQKLGLMAIFSMTVVVILFAIIRIAVNSHYDLTALDDNYWLVFWAALEFNMAIIVACCGAFRQLYKSNSKVETGNSRTVVTKSSGKPMLSSAWWNGFRGSSHKSLPDSGLDDNVPYSRDGYDAERGMVERVEHTVELKR